MRDTLWVGFLLLLVFVSNYYVQVLGNEFYKSDQKGKIFDLLHITLPDLHEYKPYNYVIITLTALSFFFIPNPIPIVKEFAGKFLLIMVVRAITTIATILPKHDKCDTQMGLLDYFKGNCYDKVFSGHTAFVLLATLIFWRQGLISPAFFYFINILNMAIIILTRSHYTVDVILAVVITYLVYDGDYHVFTDFFKAHK
jgi:hypothetical protein